MVRSQKVGCAILAGVLILEAFLGAACTKKEKKDSSSTSQETIESESEDPSSISSEETSSEIQQQPVDPVEQEAKALAAELGVSEDELHGKYEFFIKYADCVVNNPKMGEWRAYALPGSGGPCARRASGVFPGEGPDTEDGIYGHRRCIRRL